MLKRRSGEQRSAAVVDEPRDRAELRAERETPLIAVVEDISPDGVALVVLRGETQTREASTILQFPSAAQAADALLGRTVLVVMNDETPVILGIVSRQVWQQRDPDGSREAQVTLPADAARTVHLDKRRVDLEASEEIRLTCGKSSLVMRKDGTVIVRGVTIVSRASQANKIRGATVSIN